MTPPSRRVSEAHEATASWEGRTTRAVVDLDAMAANVRALRRVATGCRLMTVVKANGYGHGSIETARTALAAGADWLGVYTVGEGESLRGHGIDAPILVFGPFSVAEARRLVEHRLTPTIVDLEGAEAVQQAAGARRIPFHLKIDTGLIRAGVPDCEALSLMQALRRYPALQPEGIYTHFACADEIDKTAVERQLECFLEVSRQLEAGGFSFSIRHAANSAATLDYADTHLDMVRCGIATYGCYPSRTVSRTVGLRPALTLLSTVARLRSVPTGAGVGYGHEFRTTRQSTIALVPLGYGDGLPRLLGLSAGSVIVRGKFAKIVGRVSMDQITVDVTDVPGVCRGDAVVVIGAMGDIRQTADDLAEYAGTISYEILSGIMPRVPRVYLGSARLDPPLAVEES